MLTGFVFAASKSSTRSQSAELRYTQHALFSGSGPFFFVSTNTPGMVYIVKDPGDGRSRL